MKKEIRDMIRQKQMTGEKVGQIMIRDLVTLYQVQRDAQDLGAQPLTETEKTQLVSALGTPEEVAVYSQYKFVINYLQQVSLYHRNAWQDVEICFLRLYAALSPLDDAEQLLGVIHRFPPFMQEHEFEQAVAEEQQRRLEGEMTGEQLALGLGHWICLHPDEPLNELARQTMLGDGDIVMPWHPFDPLYKLQVRSPELYQQIIERLVREIPDFSSNDLQRQYSVREVESRFPGLYEALFGSPENAICFEGYVVPHRGAESYDPMEIEGIGVVALLDRLGTPLSQVYQLFLHACRHTLAIEEALRLLSVRVEVPELQSFLPSAQVDDRLQQLYILTERLSELPRELSVEATDALAQRVSQLFPPETIENLRPTELASQNALKALADLSLLERPSVLHQLLMNEGGVMFAP